MSLEFTHYSPPYDESVVLNIVLDIYDALTRLGHFQVTGTTVMYAPAPDGHILDLSELQAGTEIDNRVLSLMRRLPVLSPQSRIRITLGQRPLDYRDPYVLASSRHIDRRHASKINTPLDTRNAFPTDVILFDQYQGDDATLVLDIVSNTIREFGNSPGPDAFLKSNASEDAKDAYVSHYRNYPAHPAPAYLRSLLDRILKAQTMPDMNGNLVPTDDTIWPEDPAQRRMVKELRRKLLEEYYWPRQDFREADWLRDGRDLMEAAFYA